MPAPKSKNNAKQVDSLLASVREHIDTSHESLADRISGVLANQNRLLEEIYTSLKSGQPNAEAVTAVATDRAEEITPEETQDFSRLSTYSLLQQFEKLPESDVAEDEGQVEELLVEADDEPFMAIPAYQPKDPDKLSEEELRSSFVEQQQVINALTTVAQQKARKQAVLSADQLRALQQDAPKELTTLIERSLEALDQQVRLGELELSLDRARVSRQMSQLEESQERLEARARALGVTINDDGTVTDSPDARKKRKSSNRHWLSALGFGH